MDQHQVTLIVAVIALAILVAVVGFVLIRKRRSQMLRERFGPEYDRVVKKEGAVHRGEDVLPRILSKDQHYPDQFRRSETGVADLHTLELDFSGAAPDGQGVLLLNGWVDWPDGSTFRAAAQESKAGLTMPYLQMQDAEGRWKTINPDMGMPAGKPKTIAVNLQFLSASRKLRIVTSLCVYWDEIFLSEMTAEPRAIQRPIPLASADLQKIPEFSV